MLREIALTAKRIGPGWPISSASYRRTSPVSRKRSGRSMPLLSSNAGRPMDAIAKLETFIGYRGRRRNASGCLAGATSACSRMPKRRMTRRRCSTSAAPSTPMSAAWSSISINITAPATCRAFIASGSETATKCSPSLSPRWSSPHAREPENCNVADEWLNATLLGAAFDAHECDKADKLAAQVASEGAANWQIESTLEDLEAQRFTGRGQGHP